MQILDTCIFYKVTFVFIPIGNPKMKNSITITSHSIVNAIVYGVIRDTALDIVTVSSFLLL